MLFYARFWLILLLTVATGSCGAKIGHKEQDNSPMVTPISGWNGDEQDMARVPRSASEQPIGPSAQSTHATDVACDEEQLAHSRAMDDFLPALNRESELGRMEFQWFGICLFGTPGLQLSHLVQNLDQKRSGLKGVHATKDIWDAEKEGEMTLTLTFPRHAQLTSPASVTLLFSVDSIKGDGLRMKFKSHSIHPNTQTVCISEATRFLILTGGQSHAHVHLKLSVTIETWKDENKPKPSVSELQEVLMRKVDGCNMSMRPILVFLSDRDEQRTPHLKYHRNPLDEKPPSRTYLFLCELQKFLSDILPQKEGPAPQRGANAVSLDALHSLPPLSLGVSSTVSLLSGLVNSSTPTVFVFPERQQGLQTHRVEVTLDSPLLSVLRMRLDEAMAQVKQQEVGQKVIDRLQKLSELSALSPDGEDDEAVDKNRKEAQYRSILLLKALQVVLLTWEVERAQRAARADEDGSSVPSQCRLQSLTVSLRKFLLEPSTANINNCEGVCGFPLTNANNHAILLNSHIQSGQPVNRSLCCVPVDFDDLCVIELESEGTNIFFKTNVVATKCECR
ncbi:muellerian-inhibiting factor-like isoform X2 [Sinocyclocheilus anshuiensis]|uniref:muellerian-inhibiting factor-like isoform X2 n=1 Tax=Sinocyclocheilus anshuiensis TaxID=1608454 RepID=UPI0007B86304|nr:PREDICTED: muellerian-inhibiting factor-like isoform X2 [Sinocyclocheilus anshuiensis]